MKEQPKIQYPNKPHAFKGITLEQLMGLRKPPVNVPLYQFVGTHGEIEVMSRGLTMVLSREVHQNVRIAADIAVNIAQKHPDRPVWYVNTFAGIELMQQAIEEARRNNGVPEVVPALEGADLGGGDAALHASTHHALPNLHFFEVPIGQWDVEKLVEVLRGNDESRELPPPAPPAGAGGEYDLNSPPAPAGGVRGGCVGSPLVIINSFDYSPLSRRGKWGMARDLTHLMDAFDMSLVVFTQEMRLEFAAGIAGRGSIGLLCGLAERVARMKDPFEHLIRSRRLRNQPEKGTVHEAQMHAREKRSELPRKIVTIKNEHGNDEISFEGPADRHFAGSIVEYLLE